MIFSFQEASGVSALVGVGGSEGEGWNSGNTSFGIAFGNLESSPDPPVLLGQTVSTLSYEIAGGTFANDIIFIVNANVAQTFFTTIEIAGACTSLTLNETDATYSNTLISGNTVWTWPGHANPFADVGTYNITVTTPGSNIALYGANATATTEATVPTPNVEFLGAFNGDQFFTANGDLNVAGNLYCYFAGSLTPCNTYTDVTGGTRNPNPITVNVDGFLNNEIWVVSGQNTRIRVMDSANNLLQDLDNIPGIAYLSQDLTQVFVIDSIFSTDTANAASANAANWVYKIANAAGAVANTNANNIANVIANAVSFGANTIHIEAGGVTVNVGNTINFNNTAFANIAVTAFGNNSVNIAVFANATTSGTTANSSTVINGFIFQWAKYTHTASGEVGPFTDDFPVAFPNGCLSVQMTTGGGPGAAGLVVSSFTAAAFTWYTQFAGASTTAQYILAIGY